MPAALRRGMDMVETTLLVVLLSTMVGVATYQILARNLFGGGLVWGSELVHVAMLWATMIGAVSAARHNRHIRIDLVARFGGEQLQRVAARLTAVFAAVLCGALGWYAIDVIRWDFIDGTPGVGAVPAWICEAIIPIAAAIMAVSYVLRAIWPEVDTPKEAPGTDGTAPTAESGNSSPEHTPPGPDAGVRQIASRRRERPAGSAGVSPACGPEARVPSAGLSPNPRPAAHLPDAPPTPREQEP